MLRLASVALVLGGLLVGAAGGSTKAGRAAPITFSAPAVLPKATVGQPYEFSFCQPKPARGGRCGKPVGTTNPSGGFGQYYVFELRLSVPPPGLLLSYRTGILSGTPAKAGVFRFRLCVRDADKRRPGAAAPNCRPARIQLVGPPAPPPPPKAADFAGVWTGTFATTRMSDNACGSAANGTVRFELRQQGSTVSGSASYTITGGTLKPNPEESCDDLAVNGTLPLNGTVTGSRLTGSGFTLTKSGDNAFSGTFGGTVQGIGLAADIRASR